MLSNRKECFILYNDDLSMENKVKVNDATVIKVLKKATFQALHLILGIRVGAGLSKPRPNKKTPSVHCSINDWRISVELPDRLHPAYRNDQMQQNYQ